MSVAAPILAWGLLACAVPVLIHLTLRSKPQRQVFPALRFLIATHQRSTRAYRLRRFLLLTCRMLVLALLVLMLMKLGCLPGGEAMGRGWLVPAGEPVSLVICIDDSASMGYRDQGRTRVQEAVEAATAWLGNGRRVPPGSQVAVVTGSAPQAASWTDDLAAAVRQLRALEPGGHGRPVTALLERAYGLISEAAHPYREVYLFTDLTGAGWRVRPPAPPTDVPLFIVDVGREENDNAALFVEAWPSTVVPEGRPFDVPLRVRAGDRPIDAAADILIDGRRRARRSIGTIAAETEHDFTLTIPAMEQGRHAVTISLHPEDALAVDNERYMAVSVGERHRVLIVEHPAEPEVGMLLTNMIAPAELAPTTHDYDLLHRTTATLSPEDLSDARLVILADCGELTPEQWDIFREGVRDGRTLLIVPGPNTSTSTFRDAGELFPAAVQAVEAAGRTMTLAAVELEHPFLAPFADPVIDSINDRRVFRRLRLGGPVSPGTVVAPFSDGAPAIVETRIGQGSAIVLAFSPARTWGQFGTQAAPMIVLVHTILEACTPQATDIGSFTVGQSVSQPLPVMEAPVARGPLTGPKHDDSADHPGNERSTPLTARRGRFLIPTDQAGHFTVEPRAGGSEAGFSYAVNVPDEQSDARRIALSELQRWFPPGTVAVTRDLDKLDRTHATGLRQVDLAVPLAMVLITLLIVESLFANRFYGRSAIRGAAQKPHF